MSRGKHGPNNLYNYLEVHAKAMAGHIASGFVLEDGVAFGPLKTGKEYAFVLQRSRLSRSRVL